MAVKTLRITPVRHARIINKEHVPAGKIVDVEEPTAQYLIGCGSCRLAEDGEEDAVEADDVRVCSNCGAPLVPGSKFCAQCGTPTVSATAKIPTGAGAPEAVNGDPKPKARGKSCRPRRWIETFR